jgi:hypothetical protein
MAKSVKVVPEANDAIPFNGIGLTEAYETVLAAANARPEIQFPIDADWQEALNSSRRIELSIQDSSVFDEQLDRYWHLSKIVNVFLRGEIESMRLLACVRDPETGQILRVGSEGWLPSLVRRHLRRAA